MADTQYTPMACEKRRDLYTQGKLIKETLYGGVYHCVDITTDKHLCMKISSTTKPVVKHRVYDEPLTEFNLIPKLQSDLIVKFHDYFVEDDQVYIIMEYYPLGDLCDYLLDKELNYNQVMSIYKQVLKLLVFFKEAGLINLDISPENFLIESMTEEHVSIKCSDFGCTFLNDEAGRGDFKRKINNGISPGKPAYYPIEMSYHNSELKSEDTFMGYMIYMAGTFLYLCAFGFPAYQRINDDWYRYIIGGSWLKIQKTNLQPKIKEYGIEFMTIIDSMIKYDRQRIKYDTIHKLSLD